MSYPHLVVSVLCRREDEILMVHEIDNGIKCWNQPAGHVEAGESILDAAVREAQEETGYRVELSGIQGIYQNIHKNSGTHYVRISFYASAVEKLSNRLDNDIIESKWLNIHELLADKYPLRSTLTRQCLEDCRNEPIYPINIIQQFANGVPK